MATQKVCDRCGSVKQVDDNELIEFFDGSIEFNNLDLCENCFQIFAKFIDKFVETPNNKEKFVFSESHDE